MAFLHRNLASPWALTAILMAGCVPAETHEGSTGELRIAKFRYVCVNSGDYVCDDTFADADFDYAERGIPDAVAVGSEFFLEYLGKVGKKESGPDVVMEAVSHFDQPSPEMFSISKPTDASFIAVRGSGKVVDYVNIRAEEARALEVHLEQASVERIEMRVGESLWLTAVPLSADGETLGGAIAYQWSADSDELLQMDKERPEWSNRHGEGGDIQITALAAGTTQLSVKSSTLSQQVELIIQ